MVIYGFSNGFYRWKTLVRIPTSEALRQVLKLILKNLSQIKINPE
ncbi:hypothetical protein LEP1GSC103_0699 [Leptospira borgpetersenii serovar Javanica str. UI 09931]|uniref:Uncharacterized protein n=5 Tax=Leptospira borgpetersenii TaxID=174 RepID=M3F6Y4_LEPBO|nr:hypothetical protein LBBP_04312 [Leptospira borgpetersenii serovar Ballum]EKP11660.1 hypothetical protein LEP1GSC128_1035 [Leptospira borgpetersenii str. 200801926]EKQ91537.1 hypothetical protein LEP1GSC101_1136 [Leptospira borgpetersenii str. UI 09149]EKR01110.1 hypothetical protein LEP1GSC121_1687 [Leptospira borgpetersenii serovar Castellonis str. 200801910]EMF97732.1 hypothetical protein LEP1GSC123_1292 [Leptospira borgpetersenii str. 200701203]EMK13648.1 hypothetical protein LEP1GSC066